MCLCTYSQRRTWKTSLWMERATESAYLQELRWYIINSFQLLVVLFFVRSFQRQVPQLTTARFSNSTNATSMASSWCDENITNITHNTIYLFPKPSVIKKQNKIKCYEPFEASLVCVSNRTQFVNERWSLIRVRILLPSSSMTTEFMQPLHPHCIALHRSHRIGSSNKIHFSASRRSSSEHCFKIVDKIPCILPLKGWPIRGAV